jgi:hypothetical protein
MIIYSPAIGTGGGLRQTADPAVCRGTDYRRGKPKAHRPASKAISGWQRPTCDPGMFLTVPNDPSRSNSKGGLIDNRIGIVRVWRASRMD